MKHLLKCRKSMHSKSIWNFYNRLLLDFEKPQEKCDRCLLWSLRMSTRIDGVIITFIPLGFFVSEWSVSIKQTPTHKDKCCDFWHPGSQHPHSLFITTSLYLQPAPALFQNKQDHLSKLFTDKGGKQMVWKCFKDQHVYDYSRNSWTPSLRSHTRPGSTTKKKLSTHIFSQIRALICL